MAKKHFFKKNAFLSLWPKYLTEITSRGKSLCCVTVSEVSVHDWLTPLLWAWDKTENIMAEECSTGKPNSWHQEAEIEWEQGKERWDKTFSKDTLTVTYFLQLGPACLQFPPLPSNPFSCQWIIHLCVSLHWEPSLYTWAFWHSRYKP